MEREKEVVTEQSKPMMVESCNTSTLNGSPGYLHQLIQKKAFQFPDQIAVVFEEIKITYSQLEQRSNQIMWRLKELGVHKGDYVAILTEKNDLAFYAMLAVLKLGAAYIPLDPEYPPERINFILNDCSAVLLITSSQMLKKHHELNCRYLALDEEISHLEKFPVTSLSPQEVELTPESACYIIYTSGTTGKPKGVLIEHRSVYNYLQAANQIYKLDRFDHVYQGFSLAFDASVEEVWLTFAAGATLYTTRDKALRSGVGLVEFLNQNQITFLSTTPSLLSTLEPSVPSLRLLVLGGEVCQQDLVNRWSREGLRIINTYGPTEATVVTTYCECHSSKPITIGKPLQNYEVFLLNSELQQVNSESEGELCIGGVGLARGYINRPELNDSKFIIHKELGKRLYRTGDLCKFLSSGELQFIGRIDNQVKLRGFRIELNEIESVIMECPGIKNAVVAVKEFPSGVQSLVAYLIIVENKKFDKENLANLLKSRLPAFMIPNFYEVVDKFPLLHSGKIDHKKLPFPSEENLKEDYLLPSTETEELIASTWKQLFDHHQISINADFFYDLGGHSLLAARAISLLRKHEKFSSIAMTDIYQYPTIKKLALKIDSSRPKENKKQETIQEEHKVDEATRKSTWQYYLCACLQSVGCFFQFSIISWEFLAVITIITYSINTYSEYSWETLGVLFGLVFSMPPLLLLFSIAVKWLVLGRIKPGTYKLWGAYYLRWWFFTRIQRTIAPILLLSGSPLLNLYCRLMGAKIGRNCYIATTHIYAFDLLNIGDHTSINIEAGLLGYIVEDGQLKIGSINIGKRCYVGTRSILNINTSLQDDASLDDLSMLPANSNIGKGEHFSGSPAQKINSSAINKEIPETVSTLKNLQYGLLHYLGLIFVTVVYFSAYIPGTMLISYFFEEKGLLKTIFIATPIASLFFILLFCLTIYVLNKLLIGKLKPNKYKIRSGFFVRKWIIERLMEEPEFEVLAETVYFPHFLRALGGKIGKRVEIADVPHITPPLFTMHDESFSAGSVMIGVPRVHLGYATYNTTEIGSRTFIGNSAVLPPGTKLGDNCLIGCLSIAPDKINGAKSNNAWLGSPPVFLPRRETPKQFSNDEIFTPPKWLFLTRAFIEIIRVILPSIFYFLVLIGFYATWDFLSANFSTLQMILFFPFFGTGIIFGTAIVAIAIKWLLMGKYKPKVKPLWSVFIWKSDILERLHNIFIARLILEPLLGTPYASFILRLLGAKIGKRAFINSSRGFAEYDLVKLGDDVALNADCVMLTHLFEDRIFKMDYVEIGNGCSVGSFSEIIYDTVMEDHSHLGSLSLLMKGERLPANSHWQGLPSQPVLKSTTLYKIHDRV